MLYPFVLHLHQNKLHGQHNTHPGTPPQARMDPTWLDLAITAESACCLSVLCLSGEGIFVAATDCR